MRKISVIRFVKCIRTLFRASNRNVICIDIEVLSTVASIIDYHRRGMHCNKLAVYVIRVISSSNIRRICRINCFTVWILLSPRSLCFIYVETYFRPELAPNDCDGHCDLSTNQFSLSRRYGFGSRFFDSLSSCKMQSPLFSEHKTTNVQRMPTKPFLLFICLFSF